MWKFLTASETTKPRRRPRSRPEPGPLAGLARDYAALDALMWLEIRRKSHSAETEAR